MPPPQQQVQRKPSQDSGKAEKEDERVVSPDVEGVDALVLPKFEGENVQEGLPLGGELYRDSRQVQDKNILESLDPEEKKVAIQIIQHLKNPAANEEMVNFLSELSPEQQVHVRTTLAMSGWYMQSAGSNISIPEDATSGFNYLRMNYPGYSDAPFFVPMIRDLARIGAQEGFKVRVGGLTEEGKNGITQEMHQIDKIPESLAEKITNSTLEASKSRVSDLLYVEDTQYQTLQGELRIPAPVSGEAMDRFRRFSRPEALAEKLSPEEIRSFHDRAVLTTEQYRFSPYQEPKPPDPSENNSDIPQLAEVMVSDSHHDPGGEFLWLGQTNGEISNAYIERLADAGVSVKVNQTFFEGGNLLSGQRQDGSSYVIVGEDSLALSTMNMIVENKFDESAVLDRVAEMEKAGDFENQARFSEYHMRLVHAGLAREDATPEQIDMDVKTFLAKTDIVRDLMAEDFSISRDDLIFIPQADFHIDMSVQSVRPGEVFVHDPGKDIELLEKALGEAKGDEKMLLESLLEDSKTHLSTRQPIADAMARELEDANFIVYRIGGVMRNNSEGLLPARVNFLNAVSGTRKGTNEHFMITNGTNLPTLEKAFQEEMGKLGVERVYFVGRERLINEEIDMAINPANSILAHCSAGVACLVDQEK